MQEYEMQMLDISEIEPDKSDCNVDVANMLLDDFEEEGKFCVD